MSSETLRTQEQGRGMKLCVPRGQVWGEKLSVNRKQEVKLCTRREKGKGVKITLRRDQE